MFYYTHSALVGSLLLLLGALKTASAFVVPNNSRLHTTYFLHATIAPTANNNLSAESSDDNKKEVGNSQSEKDLILQRLTAIHDQSGLEFCDQFDLDGSFEGPIYSLFDAIKSTVPLGLHGTPFVLRYNEIVQALSSSSNNSGSSNSKDETLCSFPGCFTVDNLKQALEDDFLDAARGSTDSSTGWQITDVSVPRGQSFEDARMTFQDVTDALEKGTVIFNAAGAHIPRLAGPSLAASEATLLPCALNLYVTHPRKKTSAPPHTDKQDVVVIQSTGTKHWKVFSPPPLKPHVDMFTRGKMQDRLPLHVVEQECDLLLETTLQPGDVLFVPAAFPHTTSTAAAQDETSIHLTIGIDHHIWQLDYLSARKLALQRAGVVDAALGPLENDNAYIGKVNQLPLAVLKDLTAELPLGLLDDRSSDNDDLIASTTEKLMQISKFVDTNTFSQVQDVTTWRETLERIRQQGIELLDTHRDMYLAAIEEGQVRMEESAMTAHLGNSRPVLLLTQERIQRMSVFRVKQYYDKVNTSIEDLKNWANEGMIQKLQQQNGKSALPSDWAWTLVVNVGDKVEADLGGAFFPATVSRASGGTYDVNFFDGDRETNLQRDQIKLLTPPLLLQTAGADAVDTSSMTAKQLKRWKKQQNIK